jgi:predicted transcriptional regulator
MKQLLIQLDDELAARLDQVAPARSHKRSAFVRASLRAALATLDEQRTAAAYCRQPDAPDSGFDPAVWDRWDGDRT